jgi:zinc transporter ZupT
VPESIEKIGSTKTMAYFFAGVVLFALLEMLVAPAHEHGDDSSCLLKSKRRRLVTRIYLNGARSRHFEPQVRNVERGRNENKAEEQDAGVRMTVGKMAFTLGTNSPTSLSLVRLTPLIRHQPWKHTRSQFPWSL